jgi:HlyD family secretion protein
MKQRRLFILVLVVASAAASGFYFYSRNGPQSLVLTGIVTTDEVIVSSEIQGRLQQLTVGQGSNVKSNQLLAVIQPRERQAETAFYANTELQSVSQVAEAEAGLKFQEAQTSNQIQQAEASLAAAQSQVTQARAEAENARLNRDRIEDLYRKGVESVQLFDQARTGYESAQAHVEAMDKQAQAAQAAVALAKANADQVAVRRSMLESAKHQLAAAVAQKERAQVRLEYTQIRSPINGFVDVRGALEGEVVNPGQAIVTLIDPNNLWVRADVEETYIDRVRLGQNLPVRLPSGARRQGTVFYIGKDADYATQRDVSRTKRDIKTFEVRLRCDDSAGLAVGMTAYVTLALSLN